MASNMKFNTHVLARLVLSGLFLLVGNAHVSAQQAPQQLPRRKMPEDLPMHSVLYDLAQAINKQQVPTLQRASKAVAFAEKFGLKANAEGKVSVEIVNRQGQNPISSNLVNRFDGDIDAAWRHRTSAWIPPDQLINLAQALPKDFYMERANVPVPDNEGPQVMRSDAYRNGDADGRGIQIAIIDLGFANLGDAQASGAAPANLTSLDYVGGTDNEVHGTACLETVFDHAPGADYFLYRIGNVTHLGNAIDDAIANGVDIISHSLGWYNTGWDDNSGDVCAAVQNATAHGILFFTSAGNFARKHWQGSFNDSDSDTWHDWVNGDEGLNVEVPNNGEVTFHLSWNTAGDIFDFDLILTDLNLNILDESDTQGEDFETVFWRNTTGMRDTVLVFVQRLSGGDTEIELFEGDNGRWLEHVVAAGSTISPANSTQSNCISVGAVYRTNYSSASGTTGIITGYSSLGPTNSGNTAPSVCGPTGTTTVAYGGEFHGTSASAPNVAGAAAAFWSSAPQLSASAVRYLLLEKAGIFKNWGAAGFDNTYCRGGIALHTFQANTVWVDRRSGNFFGFPWLPYFFLVHAQKAAVNNGRIVFLGQNYREPITLNKPLRYESIGWPAVVGASQNGNVNLSQNAGFSEQAENRK